MDNYVGDWTLPSETPHGDPQKPVEPPPVVPAPTPAPPSAKAVSESPSTATAAYNPAGLPPEATALLGTIAGTEAQGYNVLYGGGRFSNFTDHPRQAIPIVSGPNQGKTSSAAGRYQMLADTWDEAAEAVGAKDFSPANQDKAAWWLAQRDYKARTGRDLLADLRSGDMSRVPAALAATWTSLPGGIEQTTSSGSFAARYAKALGNPLASGTGPALLPDNALFPSYRGGAANPQTFNFLDAANAALKHETTLGIIADRLAMKSFTPEPFVWDKAMQERIADLPKQDQQIIRDTAVSPDHVGYLHDMAMDRLDADKALASQGFLGSTALMFGAGLVDLPGYLAGGVAGRALLTSRALGRTARIAAHGGVFAASAAPLEATKFALDPHYDAGDVARGLAIAGLFGGGFGAMGASGAEIAARYRKFVTTGTERVAAFDAEAATAKYTADVGAAAAPPSTPAIAPSPMDRLAAKLGGWADFSVGGRLYNSKNDLISELAPKLTTIATQDLTRGARDVEGALDFVNRNASAYNMRVENALRQYFEPWAEERGLSMREKQKQVADFYNQAAALHTNPLADAATADKNIAGFVSEMRKVFADHLELAKAHGLEAAKNLEPDNFYLPRYYNRVQWRAKRAAVGIDGLEDVVAQAIRQGDPQLAARVGAGIVGRAAERDAAKALKGRMEVDPETGAKTLSPNPERQAIADRANAEAEAAAAAHTDRASGDLAAVETRRAQDVASAELDATDKATAIRADDHTTTINPNASVTRAGIRESVVAEVEKWGALERETRQAARSLPEAAHQARAKLLAEADDIRAFHEGLQRHADEAFQEAALKGRTDLSDLRDVRTEAAIRRRSVNKEAQRESAAIREERDANVRATRQAGEHIKAAEVAEVKARYWLEAFNTRMAAFEDKFVRRMARKFVETVDNTVEGRHPDIDAAFSTRDTKLVREALQRNGIVVDEGLADQIADMIAPRAQRGAQNMRRRTTFDESAAFTPAGHAPEDAFSMRDLMESDYGKIVDRYTRTMAPNYIMASHGFQSESSLRKYIADVTAQHKGIDGYNDVNAYRDRRRANYLADVIYGRDPMQEIDPRWRGLASMLSNYNYARVGASFGIAQTYDTAELVLRHGFEAFRRGVPAWDEMLQVLKHGGPEADALVRDMQVYAGIGVKGAESKIVPNFRGLDDQLADDLTGTWIKKAMRTTKAMSNTVGHLSGLNTLTDVQHFAAARIFLQTIKDVHAGTRQVSERLMADFGLSPETMARFGALLDHATVDASGIIRDLNSDLLRKIDLKTFDALMGLTRREAFRTIIEPNAGLMPMFAGNTMLGKFAFQLKSFAAVSNAVHSLGNFRLGPTYVAKSLVGGAAWASMLYGVWNYARAAGLSPEEREKRLEKAFEPSKMAFNVWNRVGMAGITPEVAGTAIAAAQKFGLVEKDADGSNYGQAARASGLISGGINSIPIVDTASSVLDTLQAGMDALMTHRDLTRYEARRAIGLIPLQNALGISNAINAATAHMPERKEH